MYRAHTNAPAFTLRLLINPRGYFCSNQLSLSWQPRRQPNTSTLQHATLITAFVGRRRACWSLPSRGQNALLDFSFCVPNNTKGLQTNTLQQAISTAQYPTGMAKLCAQVAAPCLPKRPHNSDLIIKHSHAIQEAKLSNRSHATEWPLWCSDGSRRPSTGAWTSDKWAPIRRALVSAICKHKIPQRIIIAAGDNQ